MLRASVLECELNEPTRKNHPCVRYRPRKLREPVENNDRVSLTLLDFLNIVCFLSTRIRHGNTLGNEP